MSIFNPVILTLNLFFKHVKYFLEIYFSDNGAEKCTYLIAKRL